MRFLEGRPPRLAQVPPTVRNSAMTALLPSSAACSAAAKAVEPLPRITRSYRSCGEVIVMLISLLQAGHPAWWIAPARASQMRPAHRRDRAHPSHDADA